MIEDICYISKRLAEGSNEFMIGNWNSGIHVRVGTDTKIFPVEQGGTLVLASGLTANQISAKRAQKIHVALTVQCLSRGSETEMPKAIVKVCMDGVLIGHEPTWKGCLKKNLLPEAYSEWEPRNAFQLIIYQQFKY